MNVLGHFSILGMELSNNGGSCLGISLERDFKCHLHLKRLPAVESISS